MKTYREIIAPVVQIAINEGYAVKDGVITVNGQRVKASRFMMAIEDAGLPVKDYRGRLRAVLASDQLRNALPKCK